MISMVSWNALANLSQASHIILSLNRFTNCSELAGEHLHVAIRINFMACSQAQVTFCVAVVAILTIGCLDPTQAAYSNTYNQQQQNSRNGAAGYYGRNNYRKPQYRSGKTVSIFDYKVMMSSSPATVHNLLEQMSELRKSPTCKSHLPALVQLYFCVFQSGVLLLLFFESFLNSVVTPAMFHSRH
jgi:hypothetical protein